MNIDVFKSFKVDFEAPVRAAQKIDQVDASDIFQYHLIACTWLNMFSDEGLELLDIVEYLRDFGLYKLIDQAQELSKVVLKMGDPYEVTCELGGLTEQYFQTHNYEDEAERFHFVDLLRYPKRFCPKNPKLENSCLGEFLNHRNMSERTEVRLLNAYTGTHPDRWMSRFFSHENYLTVRLIDEMRSVIAELLPEPCPMPTFKRTQRSWKKYDEAERCHSVWVKLLEYEDPDHIPTGVCCDAKTKLEKLKSLAYRHPLEFVGNPYKVSANNCIDAEICQDYPFLDVPAPAASKTGFKIYDKDTFTYCEAGAVPKTYDEYRIVCQEQCWRLSRSKFLANYLAEVLYVRTAGVINVNDQSRNMELARIASIDGVLATVDWSHASDGYCRWLCEQILPDWLVDAIRPIRSNFVKIRGKYYRNSIYLTMGHTLTPIIQSLLFYALVRVVQNVCEGFGLEFDHTIGIYNDDTILDSRLCETLFDFGRKLGLKPNEKKSFYSADFLYRESCGVEAFHGCVMHAHYWPRKRISLSSVKDLPGLYQTLVSIQHRAINFPSTSNGLIKVLRQMYPTITSSQNLTDDVSDIVWRFRTIQYVCAPMKDAPKNWESIPYLKRELHLRAVSTWPKPKDVKPNLAYEAEYFTYMEYLRLGPQYDSALDELLRVSSRRNPAKMYVDQVTQLTLKRE